MQKKYFAPAKFMLISSALLFCAACAVPQLSYSLNTQNIRVKDPRLQSPVGTIRLHMSDDDLDPTEIGLSRVRGGYTIHSLAYSDDDTVAHWVVAKDKEYKWFIGIRGRMEF